MRFFKLAALAVILGLATAPAMAANTTLSIIVNSAPSTSVTCTLTASSFTAPVAAGTNVANCVVAPSTWSGALTLSGADASSFALVQGTGALNVGSTALTASRSYAVTLTSTP
jgi:hypothetical protein